MLREHLVIAMLTLPLKILHRVDKQLSVDSFLKPSTHTMTCSMSSKNVSDSGEKPGGKSQINTSWLFHLQAT